MVNLLALCGDTCIRINHLTGTQYGACSVFAVLLLLAVTGWGKWFMRSVSGVVGMLPMSEQYTDLCDIARERKGSVTTFDQNRCNGTTDGRLMSGDWACRNDGYSGYNVASVGE